jgi:outer membrane receptor for monomeric catechols
VPPVDTDATGRIRLIVNSEQDKFRLSDISNLNGIVTGLPIHSGSSGTNELIVANINVRGAFASASAGGGGGASATTSASTGGTITSADFKGPLSGKQIFDLIKPIEDGNAYVNVHTNQNPDGEIRGQLARSANEDGDTFTGALATASTSPSASASAITP